MKGININSRGVLIPPTIAKSFGFTHVRFSVIRPMQPQQGRWEYVASLDEDLRYYEQLVSSYYRQGIQSVVVLNQELYGNGLDTPYAGSRPWDDYLQAYQGVLRRLVEALRPYSPIYQLWNEPDAEVPHSSVPLTPSQWSIVHNALAKVCAGDEIWLAGLCSAATAQVHYFKQATQHQPMRFDRYQTHLYGAWPIRATFSQASKLIKTGWFSVLEDGLRVIKRLGLPFGASEMGVAEDTPFPPEQYAAIATFYAQSYEQYVASGAKNVTFWAWSDLNRNGGLIDVHHQPKQPIYDTVYRLLASSTPARHVQTLARLNLRVAPSLTSQVMAVIPNGFKVTLLQAHLENEVWYKVNYRGLIGYVHKDFVRVV